jgi:Protein of unknown function (DUF3800)
MSVRFFYVDESYNTEKFCLSAICIKHSDWRACFKMAQEHRRNLKEDHGVFVRKEIHAHELVGGRGNIATSTVNKHTRSRIFFGLLNLIAQMPEVRLFNVCLDVKGRRDPQLDAWDRLLNRIERTMLEFEKREAITRKRLLAALPFTLPEEVSKEIRLRLLSYSPRAIIVADEGREQELTKVFRKMSVFNPIPSRYGGWAEGSSKSIPVERIIEDPIFKKSHHSFLIQLADCAAFSLLKRETPPTPTVKKYGIHNFFDECLAKICFKGASPRDPLGIVRK